MKKTILTIAIATVFAACSSKATDEATTIQTSVPVQDTNGLAQFKDWKVKQELAKSQEILNEESFSTESVVEASEPVAAPRVVQPKTRIIYRDVPAKTERVARVSTPAPRKVDNSGVRNSRSRDTESSSAPIETASTGVSNDGPGSEPSNGDVAATTPEVEKTKNEGWSKAAKGTAIGAGSGAVLGAIISKNKTKGAVIGGVVGAAGGYIFGKKQDKKDGRN